MSDIRANTISDAAGTGPIDLYKQSAAKAWCNYYHNAGVPVVSGSFNVSSVTDTSAGSGTVNVTNQFNSIGSCNAVASAWAYTGWSTTETGVGVKSPSEIIVTHVENNGGTDSNAGEKYPVMMNAHGDLA